MSVTIIATGFQTSEERIKEKANERIEIPLTPEESKIPYVKPINRFVQKEADAAESNEPVMKLDAEERDMPRPTAQQVDLFSNPVSKPQLRNSTPDKDGIIRHTLAPQERQVEDREPDNDGYEVKTTPSAFHFELPSVAEDSVPGTNDATTIGQDRPDVAPSAPAPAESAYKADEHKTPDYVEKELLKTKERILRLKELSMKLKSANGLQELETEPAYRRKQMALDDVPHSSESQVSRFTLSTDEGITEIRPNNSFLHDNVD